MKAILRFACFVALGVLLPPAIWTCNAPATVTCIRNVLTTLNFVQPNALCGNYTFLDHYRDCLNNASYTLCVADLVAEADYYGNELEALRQEFCSGGCDVHQAAACLNPLIEGVLGNNVSDPTRLEILLDPFLLIFYGTQEDMCATAASLDLMALYVCADNFMLECTFLNGEGGSGGGRKRRSTRQGNAYMQEHYFEEALEKLERQYMQPQVMRDQGYPVNRVRRHHPGFEITSFVGIINNTCTIECENYVTRNMYMYENCGSPDGAFTLVQYMAADVANGLDISGYCESFKTMIACQWEQVNCCGMLEDAVRLTFTDMFNYVASVCPTFAIGAPECVPDWLDTSGDESGSGEPLFPGNAATSLVPSVFWVFCLWLIICGF